MGVTKSPYDTNNYRVVTLENGIVALLISSTKGKAKYQHGCRQRQSHLSADESLQDDDRESEGSESESEGGSEGGSGDSDGMSSEETEEEDKREVKEEPSTLKSACAVCVDVGSLSDPPDIPGLAHLLEHMVFMGSKKYVGENTFDSFISKHGGHSNASTDYEKTVFKFCVTQPYFRKALDMFAHFFATPLLLESSLEREIEAVDSEFQMSVQSDSDRLQQLYCTMADPDHPFSNFVWGNTETLKTVPQDKGIPLAARLREFYHRHYSSHYMTVAVISADTLDDLELWTRDSFSAISHNGLPAPNFRNCPAPFGDSKFHKLYKVVPVADENEIHLTWQLPCLFHKYRVKPLNYLGWLVGHEGQGSILYHLKSRNLATDICAGNGGEGYEYNSCFNLFTCTITLTDKGHDQILECLNVVFHFLKLLRELGPQERIYREIQLVEQNSFTFREEEDPVDYVEELCEAMQYHPEEDFLTGDCLLFEYNPEVISMVTELIVPDRVNIIWSSKKFKGHCQMMEKWFGTSYSCEAIPREWKDSWQNLEACSDLHLPPPNPFLATDFTIKKPLSDIPKHVCLPSTQQYWRRMTTVGSGFVQTTPLTFQECCPRTMRDSTISIFLASCMEEPSFDSLRTKKQLGYEVYPQHHNLREVVGLSLTLVTQSSKHSVGVVSECMSDFISNCHSVLQSWTKEEFNSHVEALVREWLQPDISLEEEVLRNWAEVVHRTYRFDYLTKQVEILRGLTQQDVCDWLKTYTHAGEHHKRLRIKVQSQALCGAVVPVSVATPDGTAAEYCDGPTAAVTRVLLNESDIDDFKEKLPVYDNHTTSNTHVHAVDAL